MNELKIEDLSIGDLVYHDDIVFGREIAKVHRLNKDKNDETIGITVYRSDGAFGVVGYIWTSPTHGDLHPIPLTPEILEKNGVAFAEDYDENGGLFTCPAFSMFKYGNSYTFEVPQARVRVEYVHELQHALRLAKVGKEIVI